MRGQYRKYKVCTATCERCGGQVTPGVMKSACGWRITWACPCRETFSRYYGSENAARLALSTGRAA